MKILALSGSLRAGSLNTALLRAAEELAPDDSVDIVVPRDLPLYDKDLGGAALAAPKALGARLAAADAVLIATPEYNHSVPGVLKNAIDWTSRPANESVWRHKPVAIMGAAPGVVGTARAQAHLKTILASMLASTFPYPEFLVGQAASRFTDGRLTDPATRERLAAFMAAFRSWVGPKP